MYFGTGNNLFGEELRNRLAEIRQSQERDEYILMEKITGEPVNNYIIRCGKQPAYCSMVTELGVFGALVG